MQKTVLYDKINTFITTKYKMSSCVFCEIPKNHFIYEDDFSFALFDRHPVTKYHTLIIPKRHFSNFFDATENEIASIHKALKYLKTKLEKLDKNITGFNIGINVGKSAGQSIFHLHVHLIPRKSRDTKNPKGGVRGVIPSKMSY